MDCPFHDFNFLFMLPGQMKYRKLLRSDRIMFTLISNIERFA